MKVIIVFLLIFIINKVYCCVPKPDSEDILCNAWENLRTGDFKEYKKLYAYMVGTKHQILNEEFFDHKLMHLETISIKGGNFTFHKNVFKGLKNLRSLEITDVDHKFIVKEGIIGNTGIEVLSLHNSITDLIPNSFSNMPNASQVWIIANKLPTIKNHVFTNTLFKMIFLGNNKIEHIEDGAFLDMKNLGYLDLSGNLLKTLNTENILGKSLSLQVLAVESNKLTEITDKLLTTLPNIEIFNASNNLIKELQNGCFTNNELWLIDISKNEIEILPEDIVNNLNSLEYFFINDNNLQYIPTKLQYKLSNLEDISLSGNKWQCKCFDDMKDWLKKYEIQTMCKVKINNCFMHSQNECRYNLEDIESKYKAESECYVPDWRTFAKKRELKRWKH